MTSLEKVHQVFDLMHEGTPMTPACAQVGISKQFFLKTVDGDTALIDLYMRAREGLIEWRAENLEDIGHRAAKAETAAEVAGLRLLSENRKWLLSKLAPRKYGDKIEVETKGTLTHEFAMAELLALRQQLKLQVEE